MLSLLIVENDPLLVDLLAVIFSKPTFDVESVAGIDAARRSISRRRFDRVLVDSDPLKALCSTLVAELCELTSSAPGQTLFGLLTTTPVDLLCSPEALGFHFVVAMPFDLDDLTEAVTRRS